MPRQEGRSSSRTRRTNCRTSPPLRPPSGLPDRRSPCRPDISPPRPARPSRPTVTGCPRGTAAPAGPRAGGGRRTALGAWLTAVGVWPVVRVRPVVVRARSTVARTVAGMRPTAVGTRRTAAVARWATAPARRSRPGGSSWWGSRTSGPTPWPRAGAWSCCPRPAPASARPWTCAAPPRNWPRRRSRAWPTSSPSTCPTPSCAVRSPPTPLPTCAARCCTAYARACPSHSPASASSTGRRRPSCAA
ncbi:hypothetical protein SAFG77S_04078 [Streptomyces afghaniensis]